ncbi:MAG: hypothetical protein AB1Z23_10910 [Eubacteriales bacterium]
MKKALLIFVSIVLLVAFSTSVYAVGTYSIPELYLNVNAPDDWIVISRNAPDNAAAAKLFNVDTNYLSNYLVENSLYIDAIKKDMSNEITIAMKQDDNTKELVSLNALSDKKLNSYIQDNSSSLFSSALNVQTAPDRWGYEIYHHSQAVFIKSYVTTDIEGEQTSAIQYITIQNGQAIVVTAFADGTDITSELEATCKSFVDSIAFTQLQKGNAFAGTILGGNNLIYIAVVVILGVIISLVTKKKKPVYQTGQPVYRSSSSNTYSGSLD